VVILHLAPPSGATHDYTQGVPSLYEVALGTAREVPAYLMPSTHDVQAFDLVFQDDFGPNQTKLYELRIDQPSSIDLPDLVVDQLKDDGLGDMIQVNNGDYDFFLGHELEPLDADYNGKLPKNLYIRIEADEGWAKTMPLSQIYGNIPEFRSDWSFTTCEPIFVLSPGFPEAVDLHANPLVAVISLTYDGWAQQACPPDWVLEDPKESEYLHAQVTVTIYRAIPRVDAEVTLTVTKSFFNHNGFGMGGSQTEMDRPQVLFGTESHTILQGAVWADTQERTDLPEFMQLQDGIPIFRRGGNRDAWAPFTLLGQDSEFLDYYVVQGQDDRALFSFFPDFERLAYQQTRDEGTGYVLPMNMVGAGPSVPLMVANPILLSQTHLGGLGDVWGEIREGVYDYRLVALWGVPFGPQYYEDYDLIAEGLSSPIQVDLAP
jgi:hypothetical protein